jgi:hypothetical protein
MPTVARAGRVQFRIYYNDHPPPHVHVIAPDFDVVVDLGTLKMRDLRGREADGPRAVALVMDRQTMLFGEWQKIHG